MAIKKIQHIDGKLFLPLDEVLDDLDAKEGDEVTVSPIVREGKKYLVVKKLDLH